MIATHTTAATAAISKSLGDLIDRLGAGELEAILDCFHSHAVWIDRSVSTPIEGRGSLRSYFRRRLPFNAGLSGRIKDVIVGGERHALAVLHLGNDRWTATYRVALVLQHKRWLVTHCAETTVPERT